MRALILGTVCAISIGSAAASPTRPETPLWYGNNLQRFCGAERKSGEYAMCWSYVGAILEVVNNNSIYGLKVCLPPLFNADKAVDVTVKWLRDHPESGIEAASLVTTKALAQAYPCKTSK
jgi:Rap1a immunity proteins